MSLSLYQRDTFRSALGQHVEQFFAFDTMRNVKINARSRAAEGREFVLSAPSHDSVSLLSCPARHLSKTDCARVTDASSRRPRLVRVFVGSGDISSSSSSSSLALIVRPRRAPAAAPRSGGGRVTKKHAFGAAGGRHRQPQTRLTRRCLPRADPQPAVPFAARSCDTATRRRASRATATTTRWVQQSRSNAAAAVVSARRAFRPRAARDATRSSPRRSAAPRR